MKDHECDAKGYNNLKRGRYFHGMLLGDRDFREEQLYHSEKRRLINRMLHGRGVVCGLRLEWEPGKESLTVAPGMALDCRGNEILVCEDTALDLTRCLCPDGSDPECRDPDEKERLRDYYVGICYRETPTDPVPVYVPGSCEEKVCENSRVREGYCLKLLRRCPHPTPQDGLLKKLAECEKPTDPPADAARISKCRSQVFEAFCGQDRACPHPCDCGSCGDCVGLGRVRVDLREKTIVEVSMTECRCVVVGGRTLQYLMTSIFAGYAPKEPGVAGAATGDFNACDPLAVACWLLRRWPMERMSPTEQPATTAAGVDQKDFAKLQKEHNQLLTTLREKKTFTDVKKALQEMAPEPQETVQEPQVKNQETQEPKQKPEAKE